MKKNPSLATHVRIISCMCALFTTLSFASALTISPARLEANADPGMSLNSEFTIINEQENDQTFYTSVENFEAKGETGTPNFTPSKDGFASWIHVQEKVEIKKGEKVKIPFTVDVPQGADAGGHFAAIFLSTIPPATQGGEVSVGAKVGMLILLRVSGDIKEDGGVSFGLKDDSAKIVTTLPVDFVYRFNNQGNDRAKPTGAIHINNMFGIEADSINANPTEGNVLPKSTRRFDVRWGKNEAPKADAPFFTFVKFEMDNFALGLYSANLDISFGLSEKKANSSLYFFVFPWHLLSIVGGIFLLAVLMLKGALSRYNKFIIKQARLANGK